MPLQPDTGQESVITIKPSAEMGLQEQEHMLETDLKSTLSDKELTAITTLEREVCSRFYTNLAL